MYYLHHYFSPDFSHTNLTPTADGSLQADMRYLGYVQNVVEGQVLAELIDLARFPEIKRDPRFIYQDRHLPIGPNCKVHPDNPDKIIAATNGYVFYHNGLISIKRMLNVRSNVGFQTGNIFFVGDVAVHGDIQTDFSLMASNVLVKGHIESARVKAAHDIVCLSGVKGSNPSILKDEPTGEADTETAFIPSTLIEAGGNIRLPFCEHVQIRARGNVIIDGSCLHSTIYVSGNLVVKGRLQGGTVYANGLVYVEDRLGSDYNVPTRLMLGYDPFDYLALQKLESQIAYLKERVAFFQRMAERNEVMLQEYSPRLEFMKLKLKVALCRHGLLWRKFSLDEVHAPHCRIVVPGMVMPGCEIAIGRAYERTMDRDYNVTYTLGEDEIRCSPNKPPKT
ncbi:FapA family protein [Desulfovibrio sp. OttesenSCG-928-G15]|nr:FapA family protein [Desulfovibrio sp. OttesenSCG-928-G15]